jgi:ABC-2 type transport system ATP-binding protein
MATIVEVRGLTKQFRVAGAEPLTAVKNVDLDIHQGEIYSLLGPNGAGKTTTINMIGGLIAPTNGDALIGGHSITRQPLQAKKLLGVVPQEIALYPTLTARQNLEFFGKMYGMGGLVLAARVDEVLSFVDLTDRQHDRVEKFSGGMKRRVNIGIGLLNRPPLIYMDEPTVGIDPQNRRRILDTVLRMRDEFGMTVLYTSHLMEEVQEISDRVGIMDHGEIIAEGTVGELIQKIGEEDRLMFRVGAQAVTDEILAAFQRVDGVTSALVEAHAPPAQTETPANDGAVQTVDNLLVVRAKRGRKALPHLIQIANDAGVQVTSVEIREPDLEAVFLHMTGRALRD